MTGLGERLVEFVEALRERSILVGPSETVDAAAALRVVGLADRDQVREARGPLDDVLTEGEAASRIARFGGMVRAEALRRTAELRGRERVSRFGVAPPADVVNFTSAGQAQLAEMRRTIPPLSRKLAT